MEIDSVLYERRKPERSAKNPDAFPPAFSPPPASRLPWDKVFETWADFELVKLASDFNLSESKMAKLLKAFKDPRMKSENITLKDPNHIKILMDKLASGNAEQVGLVAESATSLYEWILNADEARATVDLHDSIIHSIRQNLRL